MHHILCVRPVLLHGAFLMRRPGGLKLARGKLEKAPAEKQEMFWKEARVKMANPKNTADLAELKGKLDAADAFVLTEYRGLTVAQLSELRNNLGFDVDYSVAKNTLFKIAAKEAGIEGLDEHLAGPTAIAFIKGEAVDAAKVMKKFAEDNGAFIVKGGYMDGNALTADQVKAIADLDNRETTLAKLAGAMKGSMAKAAALFNAPATKAVRTVAALQDKKEAEA